MWDQLNANAPAAQVIAAVGQIVLAAVLAVITWRATKAAGSSAAANERMAAANASMVEAMQQQQREQFRPVIVFKPTPLADLIRAFNDEPHAAVMAENLGPGPALDFALTFDWVARADYSGVEAWTCGPVDAVEHTSVIGHGGHTTVALYDSGGEPVRWPWMDPRTAEPCSPHTLAVLHATYRDIYGHQFTSEADLVANPTIFICLSTTRLRSADAVAAT